MSKPLYSILLLLGLVACKTTMPPNVDTKTVVQVDEDEDIRPIFSPSMQDNQPYAKKPVVEGHSDAVSKSEPKIAPQKKEDRTLIPIYRETLGEELDRIQNEQLEEIKLGFPFAEVSEDDSITVRISFDADGFFYYNADKLMVLAKERLSKLSGVLARYPASTLTIENIGEVTFSTYLLEQRGVRILESLSEMGLSAHRQAMSIYQTDEPKRYANGTISHRRVDFIIRFDRNLYQQNQEK